MLPYERTWPLQQWGLPWWHYQMETFFVLLALCAGNSLVTCEFPLQRPVTALMFYLICALNKWLSKQCWGWWFEMPSPSLWLHCNALPQIYHIHPEKPLWYLRKESSLGQVMARCLMAPSHNLNQWKLSTRENHAPLIWRQCELKFTKWQKIVRRSNLWNDHDNHDINRPISQIF